MKSQIHEINNLKTIVMSKILNKTAFLMFLVIIISFLSSCSQNVFDVADRYKVVFWFNETNSRSLLDDGADTLTFYINYQPVKKTAVDDVFWTAAPSCDDSTALSLLIDLLPRESKIYFSVKDQTGFEYYNGTQQLLINSCNAIEIGPITKFK